MVGVGCSGLVPCAAASAACVVSIDGVVSYGEARLAPSCHLPPHPTPSNPPPPPPPQEFDSKGWTTFAPHYIVWTCPAAYRSSAECASQCIRHGRYCSPDPDGDMHKGYSGADVVQVGGWVCEGMLLLLPSICCCCLPSAAAAFILTLPPPPPHDPPSQVFAAINKDSWSSVDALRQCIGGQGDDAPHPVMDAQLKAQHGDDATGEVRGRVATAETYACCCVASFVLRCVHNSDSPTLCTAADHVLCGVASP